ncbi:MAG: hypothetical protein ACRDQF_09525, partial [Thermocrispum sp.]
IDAGELTSYEIATGQLDADPDVDAAMRSTPRIDPSGIGKSDEDASGVDEQSAYHNTELYNDEDDYFQGFSPRG